MMFRKPKPISLAFYAGCIAVGVGVPLVWNLMNVPVVPGPAGGVRYVTPMVPDQVERTVVERNRENQAPETFRPEPVIPSLERTEATPEPRDRSDTYGEIVSVEAATIPEGRPVEPDVAQIPVVAEIADETDEAGTVEIEAGAEDAQADQPLVTETAEPAEATSNAPEWSAGLPGYGPADAGHAFVVFNDFRCTDCQALGAAFSEAMSDRSDIRVIVVENPFLGPESEEAARIALAALSLRGHGAWLHAHGFLLSAGGHMAERTFDAFAAAENMEPEELRLAMASSEVDTLIEANRALAERYAEADKLMILYNGEAIAIPADAEAIVALIDGPVEG